MKRKEKADRRNSVRGKDKDNDEMEEGSYTTTSKIHCQTVFAPIDSEPSNSVVPEISSGSM